MPLFNLAFLWNAEASPKDASDLTGQLDSILPRGAIQSIQATVGPAEVNIQISAAFSAYPRPTIEKLSQDVRRAAGELVEVWRLPKIERDRLLSRYFAQGRVVKDCQSAANLILDTLVNSLGRDPVEATHRAPRYEVCLDVEFKTELEFVQEHATNISNGGLFVRTELRPDVDSEVAIRIKLPNGEILESSARVAHTNSDPNRHGVGLEFKSDDPKFRSALDAYLASLV